MFRIFYSWQSDLPSNKTRSYIRECIDKAIDLAQETEAIDAERDEATQGTTGSPNIVQTIFSKIDEADLFIADVSLCYKAEKDGSSKRSPNPNVLIELGYASKVLSWERIICICNTDFGQPEELPFDIAQNRILTYSLNNQKSRNENLFATSQVIFMNIRDLRQIPQRAKNGIPHHILGTYDWAEKKVVPILKPFPTLIYSEYHAENEKLATTARALVEEIHSLTGKIVSAIENEKRIAEIAANAISSIKPLSDIMQNLLPGEIQSLKSLHLGNEVDYKEEHPDFIRNLLKIVLDVEVTESFFFFGNLKKTVLPPMLGNTTYAGSELEKQKRIKYEELTDTLLQLWIRTEYVHTFDGMLFIPIAIQNTSLTEDKDISIAIEAHGCTIVNPSAQLIVDSLEGMQGTVCEYAIIAQLFTIPEDAIVHTEEEPFDPSSISVKPPVFSLHGYQDPAKDEDDYVEELEKYIMPERLRGVYEFHVASLRPNECKWLSRGILVRPEAGKSVELIYHMKSSKSTGKLQGKLHLET